MASHPPQPIGRPPVCQACRHPERARIEALRAGGASIDALARQFGISRDIIWRHYRNHVSKERRAHLVVGPVKIEQMAGAAADESRSLLDYLSITRSVLFQQFLVAAEAGDRHGVAHVSSRLLDTLREIGRLTGELRLVSGVTVNNNTINFLGHPAFTAMQEGLLRIARAHPQAKGDIIALLRDLDARDGSLPGDSLRPVIEQSSGDSLRPTACGRFEAVDVG